MKAVVPAVAALTLLLMGASAATASALPNDPDGTIHTDIVGGTDASAPLAVSFQNVDQETGAPDNFCGGALITRQWVLTAAHCTALLSAGVTQARVGSVDWATGGQVVGVSRVIVHPDSNDVTAKGDIALVKLTKPVRARTIPLAWNAGSVGTVYRTFGWGITCDDFDNPDCLASPHYLQHLDVKRLPAAACALKDPTTGTAIFDPATMLCVDSANGSAAMSCFGDSGSPVLRQWHGVWFEVGIVLGDGDDLELRPGVCSTGPDGNPGKGMLTNTSAYLPWILHTLTGCDMGAAREFSSQVRGLSAS